MSNVDSKARSPWSTLNQIQSVSLSPPEAQTIDGEVSIPGSKSLTNRALILAALANGTSTLSGILKSDDSYWCIDALNSLGIKTELEGDTITVHGNNAVWPNKNANLYIGAAGTIARFLPGALAVAENGNWVVEASNSMSERPVKPLIDALTEMGAKIDYLDKDGYFPLRITANELQGGPVSISGKVSSQFISGVLLASPYAKKDVTVTIPDHIVQPDYVEITLNLMEKFGVQAQFTEDLKEIVIPQSEYKACDLKLEADASTASYFLALAAITNGRIKITNLSPENSQPDINMINIYEKMGCTVTRGEGFVELVGTPTLQGGFEISMLDMSDQTLTLAAIAPFATGPITIRDVEHIRYHESDRISAICTELQKLGIRVEEYKDGLTVYPGTPLAATLDSYDDHRVAMSLALIGAKIPGIVINDPGCVSKTCPTYFDLLLQLGVGVKYSS